MQSKRNYYCPKCKQVDRVEKVSAFLEAGTISVDAYAQSPSVTYTAQASKLIPPSEPEYHSPPWGYLSWRYVTFPALLLIVIVYGVITRGGNFFYLNYLTFIVVAIMSCSIAIVIIFTHSYRTRKRREAFQIAHPRWEHAMDVWNKLYYCSRDDVVFLPDNPRACVPASQMAELLYQS